MLNSRGPEPHQAELFTNHPALTKAKTRACTPIDRTLVERLGFRRVPLGAAAAAFGLGIVCARFAWHPVAELSAALALLCALALLTVASGARVAWIPVLAVWFVAGSLALEIQPSPVASTELAPYVDGLSREVQATVVRIQPLTAHASATSEEDHVAPWEATEIGPDDRGQGLAVDLDPSAIEEVTPDRASMKDVRSAGRIRAIFYAGRTPLPTLACGDRVDVNLRLKAPGRYDDPGAFQYADYLASQGITARASASAESIHDKSAGPASMACRLRAAQTWSSERLGLLVTSRANLALPSVLRLNRNDARMLDAMLFGDRTNLDHQLRTNFERTGSFHLFVVSGLHVALLAAMIFGLLIRLRTPAWLATLVTLAVCTAYATLTGFGQPAQRSLAMIAIYLIARLFFREREPLNALGAAVLAMLLWNPASMFDASLQMTVLAVVAIGGIARPITHRLFAHVTLAAKRVFRPMRGGLPAGDAQTRMMLELFGEELAEGLSRRRTHSARYLPALLFRGLCAALELMLIGVITELVMVLPMAMYFHRATPFALPANLLVIPLLGVLVPCAVLTFALSLVSSWAAMVPGAVTAALLHTMTKGVGALSQLNAADIRVPAPTTGATVLCLLMFGLCCWLVRRGARNALLTALLLPMSAVVVLWPYAALTTKGVMEVTAIDVGQGDSLLVVSPEGRTMLIDGGGPVGQHGVSEVVSSFDVGEEVVAPYLWTRRIRSLDVVVLTHAHMDHMGGLAAILRDFHPHELWVGAEAQSPIYTALLRQAAEAGIPVRRMRTGDEARLGAIDVHVLSPLPDYLNNGSPRNDDSLVMRLDYGSASALLEGDAERPSEQAMLAAGLITPVTLLKVGHHGSATSSTQDFLAAAAPVDALVSSGRGNSFGHPRADVIERIGAGGTRLFRTDELGLTTFLLTPDDGIREVVHGALLPVPRTIENALSQSPIK